VLVKGMTSSSSIAQNQPIIKRCME